ncbi:helicase [Virgibacillus phasianinus]|uniref:Helicase n=2 Tax=Virgibacillus phasianinus TaxID=2017483 RepID=A0A220U0I9_9BACI|nr:RNA polymerase recycling motor HelD [Virgibacillus phasianinus]ASK61466.1 helicase [Virgibacillus phasianinus]
MNQEAKDRAVEQNRVDDVVQEIEKKAGILTQRSHVLKENVVKLRRNFWEDVTVNLDEPDDVIETQASIKQQAELLSEKERGHGKINDQLKTLDRLKDSPYFGRIDFIENTESEKENIYIGIGSLMDYKDEDFLIYDWRAPISSIYYDFTPGKASYETVDGVISGEITLKRQFIIRNGIIKGMFDAGVTIGDKLLQQALGNNASTTMKSIVATIQKEQNQVIRNEASKYLIVQGVAGSGKTSAALQRIAYLMYRNREVLNGENIVLFSPNPLFSSYVANVLPELGEENMKQTTFLEYLESKTSSSITIESPFEQMEYVLTGEDDGGYLTKMIGIEYKSSTEFKTMIDDYISRLGSEGLLFKNITFRKEVLVSKERISSYFYSLDQAIAIPNRMELVSKWLLGEINNIQRNEQKKDWVLEEVELLEKEDYLKAYRHVQDQNDDEESLEGEEKYLRQEVVKKRLSSIKRQIKSYRFVHVLASYRKLFGEYEHVNTPVNWEQISHQTFAKLSRRFLSWEDATPFVYFQGKLIGDTTDRSIRHLIIDEAQDYSAFQYAYLQEVFPYTNMTLLGDLNQGIYTHGTREHTFLPKQMRENVEKIDLTKSYRSTKQIVEFTRCFATEGEYIQPFNREGDLPTVVQVDTIDDRNERLIAEAKRLLHKGHETLAVICKNLQECDELHQILRNKLSVTKIDEETHSFHKGILILPVYWAKGIEFDAVIIPDASAGQYVGQNDRNLFYTACTRAMHDLTIFSIHQPCTFIKEAPTDKYQIKKN